MEENTKAQKPSYEDLAKGFAEVQGQYDKLMTAYKQALEALRKRDLEYTSFFLQMLFKVVEHPDMYATEFVGWTTENIEKLMRSFVSGTGSDGKDGKKQNEAE